MYKHKAASERHDQEPRNNTAITNDFSAPSWVFGYHWKELSLVRCEIPKKIQAGLWQDAMLGHIIVQEREGQMKINTFFEHRPFRFLIVNNIFFLDIFQKFSMNHQLFPWVLSLDLGFLLRCLDGR